MRSAIRLQFPYKIEPMYTRKFVFGRARDTLPNATLRRMVHGTCATEGAGSKALYNLIDNCVTSQCRALRPQTQPTIAQLVALVTTIETGPAAFLDKWFNYLVRAVCCFLDSHTHSPAQQNRTWIKTLQSCNETNVHTIHNLVMIRCYEECVAPWLTDLHSDDDKSAAKLLLQKFLTIKK